MRRFHSLSVPFLWIASSLVMTGCGRSDQTPEIGADSSATRETADLSTSQEPPEGLQGSSPRVVILGTSLTAGYGLEDPEREGWPGQLQRMADSAGIDIAVVGAGVSGGTSAGGVRLIDWVLREPVDLLVVELGANDGLRGQDLDALEGNLEEIFARTRARYPEALLALVQMEAPTNMGPEYTRAFREVYGRVAQEAGATLVPFILDGIAGVPSLNQADGIHPTPQGHGLMARNAWPWLEPLFKEITL
jgi:acyl-CoA thioesterase-1